MKRVILGLMAITMALSGNAQTQPTGVNLRDNVLNMKMDIRQMKVLGDEQLKEIGQRTAANPITSKALAASIVKNAKAGARAKGANNQRLLAEEVAKAKYTVQDTAMWESWEGWDGSFNWCPSSWSKKTTATVKEDGEATVCPTWAVLRGDGYNLPYATDGQYMMMCDFSEENQDEWIVSPPARDRINPTNFLSFDLGYAPLYSFSVTDLKVDDNGNLVSCNYDLSKVAYDVEVLVTTNTRSTSFDIDDYKCVFRLSDYARELIKEVDIETQEGQTQMLLTRWHHYKISLEEFAGSNIRVAFRYYGSKGSYVTLDAVRVSDMLPVALYDKPEGSFFVGFGFANNNPYLDRSKTVLMPAYTESLWRNYSNTDADRFEWSYVLDEQPQSSSDRNLVAQGLTPGAFQWPKLIARGGTNSDEYIGQSHVLLDGLGTIYHSDAGKAFVGGNAAIRYTDDLLVDYRVGNFDPSKPYMAPVSPDGGYVFGTPTGSWWTSYGYNRVSGIANVYDAPASPYVFNTVSMPMSEYFTLGASIVCTVYRAQEMENGSIQICHDDVLARTNHTNEMFLGDPGKEGSQGYLLEFTFPQALVIDHPIAIEISGFDNDNVLKLAPLTQAFNHDNGKGYAYVILKNERTSENRWIEVANALSSFDQAGNMMVSHCIGMNAVFPYLHSTDGNMFEASVLGEKKTFNIDSYWNPEKGDDASSTDRWTIECSESWVKPEIFIDEAEHKYGITITAEAMPSSIERRVATVTIKALGCEEVINVKQNRDSGGEDIDNPDIEPSTDVSQYPIALYINDVESRAGDFDLDLSMKCNKENITAYQCDVYLPEGVTWKYTTDRRGNVIYNLPTFNEERTDDSYHTITPIAKMADGSYSIIVYSMNKENILETDGVLMTLPLEISQDMEAGDYNIIMKNIVLTDVDKKQTLIGKMVSKLTIPSYKIGDVNGDDLINVTDIVGIIDLMRGEGEGSIREAADVNGDGLINVTDIVGVIDLMRGEPNEAKASPFLAMAKSMRSASADCDKCNLEVIPFTVANGATASTAKLNLNNPGDEFTAFQCDVYFPEGISWATTVDKRGNVKVTQPTFNAEADRTDASYHTVNAGLNSNGSFNIVVYSMNKELILDEEGAVLDLPFAFDTNLKPGVYDITLKNIVLTRTDKSDEKPADYTFSIMVGLVEDNAIALHGDLTADAITEYNTVLAENTRVASVDLSNAKAVDGTKEITTGNKNAIIYVAEGVSIKNTKNVVVGVECANLMLTDDFNFSAPKTFTAVNATYNAGVSASLGYKTLVLPYNCDVPDGFEAYEVGSLTDNTLNMVKVETITADKPVILKNAGTAAMTATNVTVNATNGAMLDNGMLVGTYSEMLAPVGSYVLQNIGGNVAFYPVAEDKQPKVGAFRAYLTAGVSSAKALRVNFDGTVTGINAVEAETDVVTYNINGQRISNSSKGLRIVRSANGVSKRM